MYPIVARQRPGKKTVNATKNTQAIEEFLDASFSMRSVLYQRKVGEYFFAEISVSEEEHMVKR
jgi:hypothetical protein